MERPVDDMHRAIASADLRRIGEMLDRGVPLDLHLGSGGLPPLWLAIYLNQRDVVSFLLERGADINELRDLSQHAGLGEKHWEDERLGGPRLITPLIFAVSSWADHDTEEQKLRLCRLLLQRGADPSRRDALGVTALDEAVQLGQVRLADLLRRAAASPGPTSQGLAPL